MFRDGDVALEVGASHGEGLGVGVTYIALKCKAGGVNCNLWTKCASGRCDANNHCLAIVEGVRATALSGGIVASSKVVQGAVAVVFAAPAPVYVILTVAVASKHVEGMTSSRRVRSEIFDGSSCMQFGEHPLVPLRIGIVLIVTCISSCECEQLSIGVAHSEASLMNLIIIGATAAGGVLHVAGLTNIAHQP